jgi:hypothetical protein
MKLKIGQYVRHSRYGWGTILEDDAKRTIVYFRNVGIKKFATSQGTFALVAGEHGTRKSLPVKSRFGL